MSSPVSVNILGKEYQVACPEEEKVALIESARMVHENMENIRNGGKVVGLDRIAVMAALNFAHELITFRDNEDQGVESLDQKVLQLKERVSVFLEEQRQLEL